MLKIHARTALSTCVVGALAGLLTLGAAATAASAADVTVIVSSGFTQALSDTRATGHLALQGTALHIRTEGATSTDKVAEYWPVSVPLATAGEPNLEYTDLSGTGSRPGVQLVVDFNNDGSTDGILVGETVYGTDWWLNNAALQFVKDAAPQTSSGSGSGFHGTLDEWRLVFPAAQIRYTGFSLGSGVLGEGILDAVNLAGTRYIFGVEAPTTVEPAAPQLAATGADLTGSILPLLGAGVLLAGTATVLVARRGASRSHHTHRG